ncbi:alpha/beta hydrolase [Leisingera sp. HS039]|uniref:alpha/beta fold hydrolase n=1 Tax=unclassified Leisingera TaxID=2614906 RepID=UPI001070C2AE|nr:MULTISPECIES: alpha/beta hydrolase [unclassified Leisingera]MBQ4827411.1 alpha/beta hydrolase [Leisingera sp. HS039]QBR35242.1 alpha/beta hydrolase [Leisingera sp. NJS201]
MPFFETSDGLQLHYSDAGEGVPLLCLAGLTRDGRDFRYFAPHAAGCRMITLDARGRGQSDHDPDFMTYNVLREAQDVLELMDHLELGRAAILGTSRGGLVAMTLAAIAKDRLVAVILNDVGPEIPADGISRIMDYVGRRPAAKTHAQAAEALSALMAPAFPGVPAARWREEAEAFYDEDAGGLSLRYDPRLRDALLAQAAAGPPPDLWPLFMTLDGLPCGIIRGANSDILSAGTYVEMQRRLPALQAVEIPNRGHVPFLDEPEALALIHAVLDQIK